jgi:Tfp pilus assembly protein PilF
MQFAPGALAATFAGIDARTFQAPPPTCTPMKNPNDPSTWFGGGPQSLIGDLIREGATGAAGNVGEPLLEGVVRPYVVFPAYLRGLNLAEAFYLATPFLSWETVIVGDPLCQPFARKPLPQTDAIPPIDRSTDMPQFFSERRLRLASAAPGAATIAPLLVRAEARLDRGDRAGARAVLIEATKMAPDSVIAHLQLAVFEDGSDDRKAAIAAYRRVLELQPQNIIALNNLAYDLAAYANSPEEARPLAVRAVALSKRASGVVDTLGWIEHLSGNDAAAAPLVAEALRGAQADADIEFHAAVLAAGAGDNTSAAAHLREALKRDPSLERRADVIALRDQLAAAAPPTTEKRRP